MASFQERGSTYAPSRKGEKQRRTGSLGAALLTIFACAITSFNSFLLAGVSTVLRAPTPPLTLVVVNSAWDIEPDNNVFGAVRLRRLFGSKERWQRSLGDDRGLQRRSVRGYGLRGRSTPKNKERRR